MALRSMQAASAGGSAPTRVAWAAHKVGRTLGRLEVLTDRLRPWMVLAPLVIGSWLVMLAVAMSAKHNGWLYYNGGDASWYYTTAWVLGHGHLPLTLIGYGYSLLTAPLALIAGPNLLAGLPYIVLFNAIVLSPIALLCVYGLAKMLGGRRFAYLASAIWVVLPLAAIPYFYSYYRGRYVDQTLPAVLGLTPLGDFPSMVLLLVAVYFAFRAISNRSDLDALTSGLAVGFAIAVKPANLIFLPAPLAALAFARRPRETLALAGGLVPSLLALALWKYRGLGYLPAFSNGPAALASGHSISPPVGASIHLHKYVPFDWTRLTRNIDGFREFTWSRRLLEWLLLAGLIGLGRRSIAAAILIGGWLTTFLLIKGSTVADIFGGGFFRYLAPAFPAVLLLGMSVAFLVPIYGRRLAERGDTSGWPATPRARRNVLVLAGFLSALPIGLFLVFSPLTTASATGVPAGALYVPANQFPLHATMHGRRVTLSWPGQHAGGTRVVYDVFGKPDDQLSCTQLPHAAINCSYPISPTAEVRTTTWTDQPPSGQWTYRVAVAAGSLSRSGGGDLVMISRAVTVEVP